MFLKGFLFRSQKKITDKAKEGLWCVMSLQLSKEFREKSAVKRNKTISRTFIESVVNPVTKMDLFIFTGELKSAMTSGLEITRALTMMSEQTRKPIMKDIIKGILFKINQGIRISEAFSSYPWFFNGIYIELHIIRKQAASHCRSGVLHCRSGALRRRSRVLRCRKNSRYQIMPPLPLNHVRVKPRLW